MILKEIENHKLTVKMLESIRNKAFKLIKKNLGKISEYDVHQFLLSEFKNQNLITEKDGPIIAINKNTAIIHSFPTKKSKIIKKNNLVLVDVFARLKWKRMPFADITWMAYTGKQVPKRIEEAFKKVIKARNIALNFIRKELKNKTFPIARDVDAQVRNYFSKYGLEKYFTHSTGHSLGFRSCHGSVIISKKISKRLSPNLVFAIEPALYFKNKFGVRSEINCYITKKYKLIITSKLQKKITLLN